MSGDGATMHIGTKTRVVFMHNTAIHGGAVSMLDGMITVGAESYVIFKYNHAFYGGAIRLLSGTLIIDSEASLIFSHNHAATGGALWLQNSTAHVNTSGIEFYDNRASYGEAIHSFYGTMIINTNKSLL